MLGRRRCVCTAGILLTVSLTALVALVPPETGLAQSGGALPRGDEPPEPATPPAAKSAAAPAARRNCFLDLSEPPGGSAYFSADGVNLYILAQVSAAAKKPAHKSEPSKVKYSLLKVTSDRRRANAMVSFDHLPNAQLLTFGNPLKSATALAFNGQNASCFEGAAASLSFSFDKNAEKAVASVGQFELVSSPAGRMLVDLKKNAIMVYDPVTFQTKLARRIPTGERALFFDPDKRRLVTWTEAGDHRGLTAYNSDDDKTPLHLEVKRGDRVLQNGGFFGIIHPDETSNSIDIEEVSGWSGQTPGGHYKIDVPPAYPVSTAAVNANFKSHVALVFGANFAAKLKWQRVFIYNYHDAKQLGGIPVVGNQYVSFAEVSPTGDVAVFEIRDGSTRQTLGAKVFDLNKKTFDGIDLGLN